MGKKKSTPKKPTFKPWAEIYEDLEKTESGEYENRWFVKYCVMEGRTQIMALDAEDLDSALMEAAGVCGLDESEVKY